MRVVFGFWIGAIAAGLVYMLAIGLAGR